MALVLINKGRDCAQFRIRQAHLTGAFVVSAGSTARVEVEDRYLVRVVGRTTGMEYEVTSEELDAQPAHLLVFRREGEGQPPFELSRVRPQQTWGLCVESTVEQPLRLLVERLLPPFKGAATVHYLQSQCFELSSRFEVEVVIRGVLSEVLRLDSLDCTLEASVDEQGRGRVKRR
jgi:hypothetical protein